MCLRFTLADTEKESVCPWIHIANGRLINNSVLYHFPHPLPLALVFRPSRLSGGAQPERVAGWGGGGALVCSLRWQCAVQGKLAHSVLWELIIDVVVALNHYRSCSQETEVVHRPYAGLVKYTVLPHYIFIYFIILLKYELRTEDLNQWLRQYYKSDS